MTSSPVAPPDVALRAIGPGDSAAFTAIVRETLESFGCVGPGYASGDAELGDMAAAYAGPDRGFWVLADAHGTLQGGGGYAPLLGWTGEGRVCELRKLYFRPALRGQGWGQRLVAFLMQSATEAGFEWMYLETTPQMTPAIRLYERLGFERLDTHWGETGHAARCLVRMARRLPA